MADTITHTWQTVEQAAVTLNVSTRTIARRIAGGTIESRVDDNGRRQVLVETFAAAPGDDGGDALALERQTPDVGYDFDQNVDENALAIAGPAAIATQVPGQVPGGSGGASGGDVGYGGNAGSVLRVLQSTIDAARTDAARARTNARWAWAGVAVMAAALAGGGMVLVGRLTRAETKVEMLQDNVAAARTDLDRSRNDLLIVSSAKAVADQRRETAESQLGSAEARRQAIEAELASAKRQAVAATAMQTAGASQGPEKSPGTAAGTASSNATPNMLLGRLVNLPLEPEPR